MEHKLSDGTLSLLMTGRVDSSNVETVERELREICANTSFDHLELDLETLEYISSAGLRVILRLRKDYPSLKIINANAEVYDILEMTGFTEMLPVEKAYRRVSVEGCEVIGQGANGKVYRLDPDTIIKVYFNPNALNDIHRERELARKAFVMGVPTAISYDVVKVGDSFGSVFELLNATPLAAKIAAEPERVDEWAHISVDLLKKIHATELQPGDMPDEKQVVLGWADFLKDYLPEDQYTKLHALIDAVPEDHHMMHGDYHAKNIMLQNGESLLIDMDTLCMGHPIFEFASLYLSYKGYGDLNHDGVSKFLGFPYEVSVDFMNRMFRYYFDIHTDEELEAVMDKAKVVGYTRMMRRTIRRMSDTAEGQALIAHCRQQLADLLSRVDTLL